MIKTNPGLILSIVVLSALTLFLVGCANNQIFSGSKTGNDNQFLADFDLLNTTISGDMPILAGDSVAVAIDIKKGDVDIKVANENGTIAYQVDNVQTRNLMLTIKTAGTYTFGITGYKAKGSVHFKKVYE
ncbi:MAG TPA: hypothetical protein DCX37_12885 [Firmicutes bacterium]|jgi:uncharacterized lipoprotein NlpE involved in copper resistance|nr:hypothetical protein [Bacillota bacterium]